MASWGMPSPAFALQGKKSDPGVTNIRNTKASENDVRKSLTICASVPRKAQKETPR
jgi:hypothetical protein